MSQSALEAPGGAGIHETPAAGAARDFPLQATSLSRGLSRMAFALLCTGCLLLPLMFGGVHPRTWWCAALIVFGATIIVLLKDRALLLRIMSGSGFSAAGRLSGPVITVLLLFLCYCFARVMFPLLSQHAHPLSEVSAAVADLRAAQGFLVGVMWFCCVFLLARAWLGLDGLRLRILTRLLLATGIGVALIGLSHWFYDTGELFWYFTPEHVFTSERARWPFVNSDHLGHFLAPAFFLFVGAATEALRGLFRRPGARRGDLNLSQIAFDTARQREIIRLAFLLVGVVSLMICVLATLSRGAWLSIAITCVFFILGERSISRRTAAAVQPPAPEPRHRRHRRHRSGSVNSWSTFSLSLPASFQFARTVKLLAVLFAAGLCYLLLSERGVELVQGRIEYGLMYSKQDIRWQLFSDTLPMIARNPLFGVGIAAWSQFYPAFMHPLLAGVNPVYLHSDPLQLLAETGIAGMFFMLLLVAVCFRRLLQAVTTFEAERAYLCLCFGSALLSIALCSVFDFPFRIPAIVFYTAVYLAAFAASLEIPQSRTGPAENQA